MVLYSQTLRSCIAAGVLGIALVQVQLYVLQGPLLDEAKAVIGSGLADLESKIVTSVNSSLATTSVSSLRCTDCQD